MPIMSLQRYVVRNAPGSLRKTAVGIAVMQIIPNIFIIRAERFGTHFKHTEFARDANIVGNIRPVFPAEDGLCTKIGMKKIEN